MPHYWEYESNRAYDQGRDDVRRWYRPNFDYDKWSDREQDRAYFDGRKDQEREDEDRRREERQQEEREEFRRYEDRQAEQRLLEEEEYYEQQEEQERPQEQEPERPTLPASTGNAPAGGEGET